MKFLLLLGLSLMSGCLANTETHLIKVPYHYEIPPSYDQINSLKPQKLNDSVSIIDNYPIDHLGNIHQDHVINIDYNSIEKSSQKLMVKINNFKNETFKSNDLISIKVCWPCLNAFDIDLSHAFTNELNPDSSYLDIYLIIEYQMYGIPYDVNVLSEHEEFQLQLFITKLPNRIPIPLELYDIIMYLVDLIILLVTLLPYLYSWLIEVEIEGSRDEKKEKKIE